MPDLFNFLPFLGRTPIVGPSIFNAPLFGGQPPNGPSTADQDTFLPPPDPTSLLGVPFSPLATGGIGYLLGRLLGGKGNRDIGGLRGLQMGMGLGMAPIQAEQKRYDEMMGKMVESGQLVPYQAPEPVALSGPVQPGQAPLTGTPAAAPAVTFGGTRLMPAPQITAGELLPDTSLPEGIRKMRLPVSTAALEIASKQADVTRTEEGLRKYLEEQGDPGARTVPRAMLQSYTDRFVKLQQGQKALAEWNARPENRYEQTEMQQEADGTYKFVTKKLPQAEVDAKEAARQDEARLRQQQAENEKRRMEVLQAEQAAANRRYDPKYIEINDAQENLKSTRETITALQEALQKNTSVAGTPIDPNLNRSLTAQLNQQFTRMTQQTAKVDSLTAKARGETPPPEVVPQTEEQKAAAQRRGDLYKRLLAGDTIPDFPSNSQMQAEKEKAEAFFKEQIDPIVDDINTYMKDKYGMPDQAYLNSRRAAYDPAHFNAALERWKKQRRGGIGSLLRFAPGGESTPILKQLFPGGQ